MTAFAVKLDENLGRTHARFLQELGYETDRIHDEGLSGAIDEEVWEKVISEGRFLITLDLDFKPSARLPTIIRTGTRVPMMHGSPW